MALAVTTLIALVVEIYPEGVLRMSTDLVRLISNLPNWLTAAIVGFLQLAAVVTPVVVVAVLVIRRKWAVLGLLVLAGALGAILILLGQTFVEDTAPVAVQRNQKLDSWFTGRSFPSGTYLAVAAAVAIAAGPFLRRSWRRMTYVGVGAAALLRLLTASEVPINLATGLALGCVAGSLALVLLGAPPQRIDTDLVRSVLQRCGLDARSITPLRSDRGSPTVLAELPDGGAYVRVLGRESATPTCCCAGGGRCGSRASATIGRRARPGAWRRTPRWPRAWPARPERRCRRSSASPTRTSKARCCWSSSTSTECRCRP